MATRATTPGLAMRHTTVERLTMFWAIPSHTTATRVRLTIASPRDRFHLSSRIMTMSTMTLVTIQTSRICSLAVIGERRFRTQQSQQHQRPPEVQVLGAPREKYPVIYPGLSVRQSRVLIFGTPDHAFPQRGATKTKPSVCLLKFRRSEHRSAAVPSLTQRLPTLGAALGRSLGGV
jgi:hypothetical protein